MMNVFFIINNVAVTPSLDEGTILNGVTRDSVIVLLKDMGIKVEERRINIDELIAAYKIGSLQEVFGTGTAATISPIKALRYREVVMDFDLSKLKIAPALKKNLDDIKSGVVEDKYGWMLKL